MATEKRTRFELVDTNGYYLTGLEVAEWLESLDDFNSGSLPLLAEVNAEGQLTRLYIEVVE